MALTTPINTSKVREALSENNNNVGDLCRSDKINKWSKWKPVRVNTRKPLLFSQLEAINFGLTPPTATTNYASIVNTKWTYNKPIGDASSPLRIGDFRNYNHSVGAPVSVMSDRDFYKSSITSMDIMLSMNISDSDYFIGINDLIGDIGSYYYGVVFESGLNGQYKHIKTATHSIGYSGDDMGLGESKNSFTVSLIEPPFNTLQRNPIKLYHVLVNQSVPTMQTLGNATRNFLPLPSDGGNTSLIIMHEAGIAGGLRMVPDTVGASAGVGFPITNYQSIDGDSFYTTGALYIGFRLINDSDESLVFESGAYEILASQTFFGGNTTKIGANAYDTNGSIITSGIRVEANSSKFVYIGDSSVLNRRGADIATVTEPTKIFTDISIYKRSARVGSAAFSAKSHQNI